MRLRLCVLCLLVGLSPTSVFADEVENPWKKAAVGDWVSYQMESLIAGIRTEATVKITVKAKNDKEATLGIVAKSGEREAPEQESIVDLTKSYDPIKGLGALPKDLKGAKVEKVDEGKETIAIGKKKYECNWIELKISRKLLDKPLDSKAKIWICKDAPPSGVVRMEIASGEQFKMKMTIDDHGHAK